MYFEFYYVFIFEIKYQPFNFTTFGQTRSKVMKFLLILHLTLRSNKVHRKEIDIKISIYILVENKTCIATAYPQCSQTVFFYYHHYRMFVYKMTNKTATKDDMRGHIESFEIKLNKGSSSQRYTSPPPGLRAG